jgi:hypothetical protein
LDFRKALIEILGLWDLTRRIREERRDLRHLVTEDKSAEGEDAVPVVLLGPVPLNPDLSALNGKFGPTTSRLSLDPSQNLSHSTRPNHALGWRTGDHVQ